MSLEVQEVGNKKIWEDFLLNCREKTFLNSWNWGEFQKMMGNKIWRLGIYNNEQLISVALLVKMVAKRGTFLLIPHGPNIREQKTENRKQILESLLAELKKIARQEKVDFIRVSPIWERNEENIRIFGELGFREAPIHIHPELTWELDITPTEEKLLMGMRKTTRYLIRQAQKIKEIEIIKSQNLEDIEKFNQLYQLTVGRHHFAPFSLDYLKNEFLAFFPDKEISIFLGRSKKELISAGIFIFWQGVGFYHHGASSLKYSKIPVSYLILWEAIKEAKRRGCQKFNFWGIAPTYSSNGYPKKTHPWYGLTLFKMGFGGYKKEYVKTHDFPLSEKYWLNYIIEKLRKAKRGL
jgi:lipid II:glycine glycyltransferase (peptidoglycan interpeptide bridge formation enzyme)